MRHSLKHIQRSQDGWRSRRDGDPTRPGYLRTIEDNLFSGGLSPQTSKEFTLADGEELKNSANRPAKMRACMSSSALAVNFFDPWRNKDLRALSAAVGLTPQIAELGFEYKPTRYPVGPRSPNLDLMLVLQDGQRVGVESKFAEPYRGRKGANVSSKYTRQGEDLWKRCGLPRCQKIATALTAWQSLDVPQVLKHMLGLASERDEPSSLLYLWYDTGLPDAQEHRNEIDRYAAMVAGDRVHFRAATYQSVFDTLSGHDEPKVGWRAWMADRYFGDTAVTPATNTTGGEG